MAGEQRREKVGGKEDDVRYNGADLGERGGGKSRRRLGGTNEEMGAELQKGGGAVERVKEGTVPVISKRRGDNQGINAVLTFALGGISGIATSALLQPLDVIKTHMQAGEVERKAVGVLTSSSTSSGNPTMKRVVTTIFKKEGLSGFWRGLGPTCIRVGLGAGLYFALLDSMLSGLRVIYAPVANFGVDGSDTSSLLTGSSQSDLTKEAKVPSSLYAAAAIVTRSLAATMLCPMTVVKTRMEYASVTGQVYSSTLYALKTIGRAEGLRGLYSGLIPTLVRDVPYSGLYLLTYGQIRESSRALQLAKNIPQPYINFVAGAIAGGSSTLLTHPPDVIRTRLQLQSSETSRSAWQLARIMLEKEGVMSFFSGATPRVAKRALQMALSWSIYEELLSRLLNRNMWGEKGNS